MNDKQFFFSACRSYAYTIYSIFGLKLTGIESQLFMTVEWTEQ